jgi:chorismate mutase
MVNKKILSYRKKIDKIDDRINLLLDERLKNVKKIMQLKKRISIKKIDVSREKEIISRLFKKYPANKKLIINVYKKIFGFTRKI